MQNILIVCMGNICRSPMAEALLRERLNKAEQRPNVSSAGISALVGHNAAPLAQEVMLAKGIDISNHKARQITQSILLQAELILVMETKQQQEIEFNFAGICGRVHRLGKWSGFDIPDPYRRPKQAFEQTFALIDQCIQDWQARLWK